jgi:serine/threonine protein kinase
MTSDDPLLGHKFGSYQIVSELGRGGMGKVYLAEHPAIGKKIAIKVLHQEFSKEDSILQRFFHEAKAANDIRHQNVVDVLDVGRTEDGLYYLLMEYLNGVTVFDALRSQGRFCAERIGHIGLQLCSALAAAHQRGIIHRDLKADNVFLISSGGQKDFVKLLDFGIAKLLEFEVDGKALTQDGFVLGTPAYMAPEQALGQNVDQQSDIYSLGVILYQMATCSLPFVDSNPVVVATMHVSAELPLPRERCPEISAALEAVILNCLAKHKEDRYGTMMEVALALSLACRVDPRPYFELELQQQLGSLLAALQQPLPAPQLVSLQPTVRSYVVGDSTPADQELTEQSIAPKILLPTVRLNRRLSKVSRVGAVAMLCGGLMLGLLYWGLSSAALAREPFGLPRAALMLMPSGPQELPAKQPLALEATPTPLSLQTKPIPNREAIPTALALQATPTPALEAKPVLLPIKDLPQKTKKTLPIKKSATSKKELQAESKKPQLLNPFGNPFGLRPKRR